jgi:hypothetical protein
MPPPWQAMAMFLVSMVILLIIARIKHKRPGVSPCERSYKVADLAAIALIRALRQQWMGKTQA